MTIFERPLSAYLDNEWRSFVIQIAPDGRFVVFEVHGTEISMMPGVWTEVGIVDDSLLSAPAAAAAIIETRLRTQNLS
jgi:hypothetical protein